MISYGMALIIVSIAVYVIVSSGLFTPYISPDTCTPTPGFLCVSFIVNTNGTMNMRLSQLTGTDIEIHGVACSTAVNNTNASLPAYGNIYVVPYSAMTSAYPSNALASPMSMQSDSSNTLQSYCYSNRGYATSKLGNMFTGYVWLNYTVAGLTKTNIVRVASVTSKYT